MTHRRIAATGWKDHRYDRALELLQAWIDQHHRKAPQDAAADCAVRAGFPNGRSLLPLFRHGYLVTDPDGRRVAALLD